MTNKQIHNIVGIDISDSAVACVALHDGSVVSTARASVPEGVIEKGSVKQQGEFIRIISDSLMRAEPMPLRINANTHLAVLIPKARLWG